ncbi:MAG: hypothetical protein Ct9H300mP1_06240 [Planctomycetaceae bacterium]|nr:MAG: hypothetical protein Ct9H300mP1_06240 [Planctomycetaceae bacterium]
MLNHNRMMAQRGYLSDLKLEQAEFDLSQRGKRIWASGKPISMS